MKCPSDTFELLVVGGAALALNGFKDQTRDIDLLRPEKLDGSLKEGIAYNVSEFVFPFLFKVEARFRG